MSSKKKLLVGAHMSAAGGVSNAIYEAVKYGANIVQLFTANQRTWNTKDISAEEIDLFKKAKTESNLSHIASHNSYLINLGSPKKELREKSIKAFEKELHRCHKLEIDYLIFHPGAATGEDIDTCLDNICNSLSSIAPLAKKGPTRLLIETTAGQGSNVGYKFEHLDFILNKIGKKCHMGICIDTSHIFAAGYDIRTKKGIDIMLKEFDEIIGLEHLYAFHFNDSLTDFGSRKDRHANIGKGKIGLECFKYLMTNAKTKYIPKYLETPFGEKHWKDEIKMLKKFGGE